MIDAVKNEELRNKAVELGLCDQWQGLWSNDWNDNKMIAKYKEGIDFCLANDFPSVEYIKSHFKCDISESESKKFHLLLCK